MPSVQLNAKQLFASAVRQDGVPFFSSVQIGKWFGESFQKALGNDSRWKVRFLDSSTWRLPEIDPNEIYFEPIGFWLLNWYLRKKKPERFAAACRILSDFLEYKQPEEISIKSKMDVFKKRIKKINAAPMHERCLKLKRLAQSLEISLTTVYRWNKFFKTHGELSPRYPKGFLHPQVKKNIQEWATIIRARKAGLSYGQIARVVDKHESIIRRVLKKDALIQEKIEQAAMKEKSNA